MSHAASTSQAAMLPGFLIPAWQTTSKNNRQPRQFSTTPRCQSKLGRTPITVPQGVELIMGEPTAKRGTRDWQPTVTKTIAVTGPLGMNGARRKHSL